MAESGTKLYGRSHELQWLARHLLPTIPDRIAPPVVLLCGPEGSGKSALGEAFLQDILARDGKRFGVLIFRAGEAEGKQHLNDFPDALLNSVRTNVGVLKERTYQLNQLFAERKGADGGSGGASPDSYDLRGSPLILQTPPTLIATDPEATEMASLWVNSLSEWLIKGETETSPNLRFVFFFDAFSNFSPSIKQWIGSTLFTHLTQHDDLPTCAFLITSPEKWDVGGQADYWRAHPKSFQQLEMESIRRDLCMQWLEDEGHPKEWVDALLEKTEGLPGRIEAILRQPDKLCDFILKADVNQDLNYSLSALERRWLHAACMTDRTSLEFLQVLLGKKEGTEAFEWLINRNPVQGMRILQTEGECFAYIGVSAREHILREALYLLPSRHREFSEKARLFSQLSLKVPSAQERATLRILAPLQPFNETMLVSLFPQDEP